MSKLLETLCHISCFLALLCFLIVLFQNKFRFYSKMLILLCIASTFLVIAFWTFYEATLPLLPTAYLWTFGFPLFFLPGSLLYLYIKSVLRKTKKFNKWDLIHLIPAFLHFIELLPFYMLPTEAKQTSLALYIMHPDQVSPGSAFLLPMRIHDILKGLVWMTYNILTIRLLIKFNKQNKLWIKRNKSIWFWFTRLTAINASTLLINIFIFLFFDYNDFLQYSVIASIYIILISIITLMFNPKILYGFKDQFINDKKTEILSKTLELGPHKIQDYKSRIIEIVNDRKIFLVKNYTITEMAHDLDIPLHHLSFIINKEFGTNFANYINKCRVNYIIERRNNPEWSQFSLEGIGAEAGFNSRNTFFKAFKIATGETPSEYFKKSSRN